MGFKKGRNHIINNCGRITELPYNPGVENAVAIYSNKQSTDSTNEIEKLRKFGSLLKVDMFINIKYQNQFLDLNEQSQTDHRQVYGVCILYDKDAADKKKIYILTEYDRDEMISTVFRFGDEFYLDFKNLASDSNGETPVNCRDLITRHVRGISVEQQDTDSINSLILTNPVEKVLHSK